jgi:hypothetical protein
VPRKIEHQSKACTESRRRSGLRRQCTVLPNSAADGAPGEAARAGGAGGGGRGGGGGGGGGLLSTYIDEAMTSHECVHKLYHYDHQPALQNLAGNLAGFKSLS